MTYQGPQPQPVYVVQPVPPRRPPTPGLAIGGFVSALLWGFGFLALAGLVLSVLGYRQAVKIGAPTGLAVAGIVLGALGVISGAVFIGTGIASWSS